MITSDSNTEQKKQTRQNQQQEEALHRKKNDNANASEWNEDSYEDNACCVLGYN